MTQFCFRIVLGVLLLVAGWAAPWMAKAQSLTSDTLSFELSAYNNLIVEATINEVDTLRLKFDSGATGLLLKHEAIAERTRLLVDSSETVPTRNYVPLRQRVTLGLGDMRFDTLEVWPVARSGQGSDGRFGWDLFDDQVVEMDYTNNRFVVYTYLPAKVKGYTKLPLEHCRSLLCIPGQMLVDTAYSARFLFDSGYQRALLLDSTLAAGEGFRFAGLETVKVNELRNGAGEVFRTRVVVLPQATFAGHAIDTFPMQILNLPNPASFPVHILGNELLKRFDTVLDLREDVVYLRPNKWMNEGWADL